MPTRSEGRDLHVDQFLSNVAIGYRADGFIGDMIFPVVPVQKQTDKYAIFSRREALAVEDTKRARGAEAHKIDRSVSSDTFHCENYAIKDSLPIEDIENMDPIFRTELEAGRARFLTGKIQLDWENRVAGIVTSTSNVGTSAGVASEWDGAGDVIGDINTMIDNVHDTTGKRPNRMIMGLDAWRSARRDSTVRNLIFGTNNGGGFASRAAFMDLFEIDELLIGGTFKDTANEAQAESLAKIWLDHVIVYVAPSRPSVEEPSFGYTFRWRRPRIPAMTAERHPFDSKTKTEEVEVGVYQDEKITGSIYAGFLISVNSST